MRSASSDAGKPDLGFRNVREEGQFRLVLALRRTFPGALCALRTDCSPVKPATASWRAPDSPDQTGSTTAPSQFHQWLLGITHGLLAKQTLEQPSARHCDRSCATPKAVSWSRTTFASNAPSAKFPLAERILCSRTRRVASVPPRRCSRRWVPVA